MTDSSSLANALSEPLRQPFWWAALASVGLHGVLGISTPTLSSLIYGGNSSKNLPGSVGLIQLTPAEVARLPQTIPPRASNTPFSIAPVPLLPPPNLAPSLPPAPGAVNLPALPPGMPPPGFFPPFLPPPFLPPPLAPETATSALPPPKTPSQNFPAPPLKTPTFLPPPPGGGIQIFPPLPGNFDRNIPPPPSPETGLPLFPPGGLQQDEGQTLQERIARSRIPGLSDPNNISSPDYPGYQNPDAKRVPKLTQKDPNKRNLITETPEEKNRRQQFEAGQRQLGGPGQPDSNISSNRETQLAAASTYIALFERFRTAYPDLEMTGPTPLNVPYPAAACSQKLEGVAVFGVVVNPQGLIRAELQPIVQTGYSILDNAAKTAITNPSLTTFSAASVHKLYQLAVPFKYDEKVCSGIPSTPPNPAGQQPPAIAPTEPKPTGQPASPAPAEVKPPQFEKPPAGRAKPQPEAKPSPSPQPQPAAKPSPSPQPKPAAEQSPPSPEPAPSPAEVSPSPELAPSPAEVSPSPEPAPSPAEVSPSPEPAPSPAEVSPSPEPAPSPATTN